MQQAMSAVARIERGKPLRFTHLHLKNWSNFVKSDVDLQRRVFLVGPNASGKSNFLHVFTFLRDIVAVGGGFREAVEKRGGVSSIRSLAAREYSSISVHVCIGDYKDPDIWEYELEFNQDNRRRPIVKQERVARNGEVLLVRPNAEDLNDREMLTQTYLEQVNVNREFRGISDFFSSARYLHIVPQLVREPDRSVGIKNDPFGGDFLKLIDATPERTRKARLRRIQEALRVAVPQLEEITLWRDGQGNPHLRGRYKHWRAKGAWQTEEQFSDGTLRLFGLLWAALDGTGPLLLEEPELSLHPEVIRYFPQLIARIQRKSGRQIILSTHSSDLLHDPGIGLDEVLMLFPSREGTTVSPASTFTEIGELLEGGVPLNEIVIPRTRPENPEQLVLFGDQ